MRSAFRYAGQISISRTASKAIIRQPSAAPYQRQPGWGESSAARARPAIQLSKKPAKTMSTAAASGSSQRGTIPCIARTAANPATWAAIGKRESAGAGSPVRVSTGIKWPIAARINGKIAMENARCATAGGEPIPLKASAALQKSAAKVRLAVVSNQVTTAKSITMAPGSRCLYSMFRRSP